MAVLSLTFCQGVCGRYSTWRLSGKPTKVQQRLQKRDSHNYKSKLCQTRGLITCYYCWVNNTWELQPRDRCFEVRLLNEDEARDLDMGPCAEDY